MQTLIYICKCDPTNQGSVEQRGRGGNAANFCNSVLFSLQRNDGEASIRAHPAGLGRSKINTGTDSITRCLCACDSLAKFTRPVGGRLDGAFAAQQPLKGLAEFRTEDGVDDRIER